MECYFNSIKVQLELPRDGFLLAKWKFQFHKGTIRTAKTKACRVGVMLISIP